MTKAEIVKAARAVWRMRQPEIAKRIRAGDARRELENRDIERAVGVESDDAEYGASAFDEGAAGNGNGAGVSRAEKIGKKEKGRNG